MADRGLRSRSVTSDENSFDKVDNIDMDSNNTILESEAKRAVRANPVVEVNVEDSEVTAVNSTNATMSNVTSQVQDLLATVMAAIQTEIIKQTAAFQTEVA
jgi:hypothetical protein